MAQIICTNCGAPLTAEHVNIQKLVAICPKCSHIFAIDPPVQLSPETLTKRDKAKRPAIFEVQESHDEFHMSYLWRKGADRSLMAALSITPIALGIVFTLVAASAHSAAPLGAIGVPIMLLGIYILLTLVFNRSTLSVTPNELTVKGTPLYWPMVNYRFKLSDVERAKSVPMGMSTDPEQDLYTVFVYLRNGRRKRFMAGLSLDQGQYLVEQISYYVEQNAQESGEEQADVIELSSERPSLQLGPDGELLPLTADSETQEAESNGHRS